MPSSSPMVPGAGPMRASWLLSKGKERAESHGWSVWVYEPFFRYTHLCFLQFNANLRIKIKVDSNLPIYLMFVLTTFRVEEFSHSIFFCFLIAADIAGLLVDTLMDPVLTSTMLAELKPATGAWRNPNYPASFGELHQATINIYSIYNIYSLSTIF